MKLYMMRSKEHPDFYVAKVDPTYGVHHILKPEKKGKWIEGYPFGQSAHGELHWFTRKDERGQFKRAPGMWTTARALRQIITAGRPHQTIIDLDKQSVEFKDVPHSLDAIEVVVVENGQERVVSAREVFHNKELYK